MTAIVHDAYGTVLEDVLRLEEMDKPTIADEQVLASIGDRTRVIKSNSG
jgi:hypothetical protein